MDGVTYRMHLICAKYGNYCQKRSIQSSYKDDMLINLTKKKSGDGILVKILRYTTEREDEQPYIQAIIIARLSLLHTKLPCRPQYLKQMPYPTIWVLDGL